jgi:hypothetical protein
MREEHGETHVDKGHVATQSAHGHAGDEDHSAMSHEGMHHEMKPDVTRPQLAVVGLLTMLALVASVLIPAQFVNLTYSAEEVGGAIMPPGMVMSGRGLLLRPRRRSRRPDSRAKDRGRDKGLRPYSFCHRVEHPSG